MSDSDFHETLLLSVGSCNKNLENNSLMSPQNATNSSKPRVDHTYHDYCFHVLETEVTNPHSNNWQEASNEEEAQHEGSHQECCRLFPVKLHFMLDQAQSENFDRIISWQSHGRCFKVHQPKRFVTDVLPKWFRQTKMASFRRQLNLYGFCRLTTGPDRGAYYHEFFLRGHRDLCERMVRTRVKGTGVRPASSPLTEPNFYNMSPCCAMVHSGSSSLPDLRLLDVPTTSQATISDPQCPITHESALPTPPPYLLMRDIQSTSTCSTPLSCSSPLFFSNIDDEFDQSVLSCEIDLDW